MTTSLSTLVCGLLSSRKFAALALGLLLLALAHLQLDPEQARSLTEKTTALVAAYLLGQGVADHGKEAARAAQATNHPRFDTSKE